MADGAKRSVWGKALGCVLQFHLLGSTLSFLYFSYEFARTHGFWTWVLLGEIGPMLKALVWEYFVVVSVLTAIGGPNPYEASWSRYEEIVGMIRESPGQTKIFDYIAANGTQQSITLSYSQDRGLEVRTRTPMTTLDGSNSEEFVIILNDADLNRKPETATIMDSSGETQQLTLDPQDKTHEGLFTIWAVGVAQAAKELPADPVESR